MPRGRSVPQRAGGSPDPEADAQSRQGFANSAAGPGEGQAGRQVPGVPAWQGAQNWNSGWAEGRGAGRLSADGSPLGLGWVAAQLFITVTALATAPPAPPRERPECRLGESGTSRPRSTPGLAPRWPGPARPPGSDPNSTLLLLAHCQVSPSSRAQQAGGTATAPLESGGQGFTVSGMVFQSGCLPKAWEWPPCARFLSRPRPGATRWALCTLQAVACAWTGHRPRLQPPGERRPSGSAISPEYDL